MILLAVGLYVSILRNFGFFLKPQFRYHRGLICYYTGDSS